MSIIFDFLFYRDNRSEIRNAAPARGLCLTPQEVAEVMITTSECMISMSNITYFTMSLLHGCYFFMLAVFHGSSRLQLFPAWDVLAKQLLTDSYCRSNVSSVCNSTSTLLVTDSYLRVYEAPFSVNDIITFTDMSAPTHMHSSPSRRRSCFIISLTHSSRFYLFCPNWVWVFFFFFASTRVWIIASPKRQMIFIIQYHDKIHVWRVCTA